MAVGYSQGAALALRLAALGAVDGAVSVAGMLPAGSLPGWSTQGTCEFDTSADKEPITPGWGTQNEMCLATLYMTVPLSALADGS